MFYILQIKVAFQTTTSLLSELTEEYLNNEEVADTGRKIELQEELMIEFNNGAKQVHIVVEV